MLAWLLRFLLMALFAAAMIVAVATLHVDGFTLLGVMAGFGWFILAGGFTAGFWFHSGQ